MFTSYERYRFLDRMKREEGLSPKVERNFKLLLGTSSAKVYEISLSLALFLAIVAFKFFPFQLEKKHIVVTTKEMVSFEDVEQTRQENRPPPPPRPAVPIEAPAAEALEDVDIASSEINVAEQVPPPPPPAANEGDRDEDYFVVVEDIPQLIGGYEALMSKVGYPQIALRAGIQGKVNLIAFVNEQGTVNRVEVIAGLAGGCTEAAVEAVKHAKFTPGKQRGRPVKVKVALSIRFKITGSTS
ncbi:MAG TPA: energy transducer TonB [Bacteroidota bacterium]